MEITRGSVYWIDLNPTQGSEIQKIRPCVVVGINPINQERKTVVVIPLSTAGKARPPLTIQVRCQDTEAIAVIDQIRAVDKSRLKGKLSELSLEEMESIKKALTVVLGIE